jgi:phosphatidylglycerophosphatase C
MSQVNNFEEIRSKPVVAAFDFDGTLTRRDTLFPFLALSLGWPRLLWVLLLSGPWLIAYILGLMSNHQAKARVLKVSLAGRSQEVVERKARHFVEQYLPGQWEPWGMAQLLQHRQMGHRCVVVSASPGIYLHLLAANLKMDGLLCTEMIVKNGCYTGAMATPNCHGEQKVLRLQDWLRDTFPADVQPLIYAYGDSVGDVPMLRLADHAWYRNKPWLDHGKH